MRTWTSRLIALLVLGIGAFIAFSLTRGQEGLTLPPSPPGTPADNGARPLIPANLQRPAPDLSRLSQTQQQNYQVYGNVAESAAEWLARMNGVDGRFLYGYLPALKSSMEGDHYLRQIGATVALAQAARFFTQRQDYAARATQAVVRFLDDTVVDPRDPSMRSTAPERAITNRLAAAGMLVLAIHELPSPQADLLEKSDQLCNFIRLQQQADGSLIVQEGVDPRVAGEDVEAVSNFAGPALYALMRSQQHRPAAWKTDVTRKAFAYYQPWWRAHKNPTFVPMQTAAFTEAYLQTKEPAFGAFVAEMTDWLCSLQYEQLDPLHAEWWGGFKGWQNGAAVASVPQVSSAAYAEALVNACRVARQAGDVQRFDRYRASLELCLKFVARLQYIEANTQHFVADYRRTRLLGGFHASPEDGNLRIDYNQVVVSALVQYLTYVAAS